MIKRLELPSPLPGFPIIQYLFLVSLATCSGEVWRICKFLIKQSDDFFKTWVLYLSCPLLLHPMKKSREFGILNQITPFTNRDAPGGFEMLPTAGKTSNPWWAVYFANFLFSWALWGRKQHFKSLAQLSSFFKLYKNVLTMSRLLNWTKAYLTISRSGHSHMRRFKITPKVNWIKCRRCYFCMPAR